jgi:multidrug resistance protein MdtO
MMWVSFDQLWSAPAGVEMRRTFVSTLRLLAQFSREPASGDIQAAIQRVSTLRETINSSFDKVMSFADGVLFEFGPSRQRDLRFRDHIRPWLAKLRTLFLMRIALHEDRLYFNRVGLPEPVRLSLRDYDDHCSQVLQGIADRIEGQTREAIRVNPIEALERALNACCRQDAPFVPVARVRSLVALLRAIDALTTSLDKEIIVT